MNKIKMKGIKILTTLLLTVMCLVTAATPVLAGDYTAGNIQSIVNDYGPKGSKNDSSSFHSNIAGFFSNSKGGLKTSKITAPDGKEYYYNPTEKASIASSANSIVEAEVKSDEDKTDREENIHKLTEVTDGMNLGADVETASGILSGFTGVIATLLGILTVCISIGMTIFSAFDLCYIAFPVFRNKCEDAKQSGSGIMASKSKGADGSNKLRFVSDDAQYAVTAATTEQSGQNPFVIYFKKRILSYLVLAILLFILLTGRITVLTEIAIKLVDGILALIQGV